MALRSIAVFVDPTPASEAPLRYAVEMAVRHGAHLVGIFVVPSGWEGNASSYFVRGEDAIRTMLERHDAERAAAVDGAGRHFREASGRSTTSYEFRVVEGIDAVEEVLVNVLHVDLVLVGRTMELPHGLSAEWLLFASAVPFLIVPEDWRANAVGGVGERLLLGWNASREARRAITDAMPLLERAESCHVVLVDPAGNSRHGEDPGASIAHFLSQHEVKVTLVQLVSRGAAIDRVLLDYGASVGTDLIVIGAYSHGRRYEAVFGGVTRRLVEASPIPLLIVH